MSARVVGLLVVVAGLVVCAPARAGVVSTTHGTTEVYKGGTIRTSTVEYVAGAGERNDVHIDVGAAVLVLVDFAGARPGAGCVARSATTVACDVGRLVGGSVRLGDGDDRLAAMTGFFESPVNADGGAGSDVLYGASLIGGPGNDLLYGWTVSGGPGADRLSGDTVSYADRGLPIHADLEGDADDGAAGEGDRILPGVRRIDGGLGDDELVGSAEKEQLYGSGGDDQLIGGAGNDWLYGGLGRDSLDGGPGDDRLYGAADAFAGGAPIAPDGVGGVLSGGPGDDELYGDPGADRLIAGDGYDVVGGAGGADVIETQDRSLDRVTCGPRTAAAGTAWLDGRDLARGCLSVQRSQRGLPRILVLGQNEAERDGLLNTGIGCSQDQPHGCSGSLRLTRRGRTLDRRRLRIRAGAAKLYRLRYPPRYAARRTCRRRVRLSVVLTARDTTGRVRRTRTPIAVGSLGLGCASNSSMLTVNDAGW